MTKHAVTPEDLVHQRMAARIEDDLRQWRAELETLESAPARIAIVKAQIAHSEKKLAELNALLPDAPVVTEKPARPIPPKLPSDAVKA